MHRASPRADANGRSISTITPRWNKRLRELWVGDVLIKRFLVPAAVQEQILDAFEEEGWPEGIDDPLTWSAATEPKSRLRVAIRHLNRCQANRRLRFRGNGLGTGVLWELVD